MMKPFRASYHRQLAEVEIRVIDQTIWRMSDRAAHSLHLLHTMVKLRHSTWLILFNLINCKGKLNICCFGTQILIQITCRTVSVEFF